MAPLTPTFSNAQHLASRPVCLSIHSPRALKRLCPQHPRVRCCRGELPWACRPRPGPRPPHTIHTLPVLSPSRPEDAPHPHTGRDPGLPLLWWLLGPLEPPRWEPCSSRGRVVIRTDNKGTLFSWDEVFVNA